MIEEKDYEKFKEMYDYKRKIEYNKEKIKKREIDVDILSLSATPIPRTLSLALNGVRDLSVINTPPENRIPVNNYLSVFSEDLLTLDLSN